MQMCAYEVHNNLCRCNNCTHTIISDASEGMFVEHMVLPSINCNVMMFVKLDTLDLLGLAKQKTAI